MAQQEGSKNPFYETSIFTTQTEQLTQKVSKGNVSSEIRTPIISLYPPPVRVGIQSPTDNILSPCSAKLQAKKTKTFNKAIKPFLMSKALANAAREEENSKNRDHCEGEAE